MLTYSAEQHNSKLQCSWLPESLSAYRCGTASLYARPERRMLRKVVTCRALRCLCPAIAGEYLEASLIPSLKHYGPGAVSERCSAENPRTVQRMVALRVHLFHPLLRDRAFAVRSQTAHSVCEEEQRQILHAIYLV